MFAILKLFSPTHLIAIAIAAAVVFTAGAGAGWTANGWRLGADLEHQKGLTAQMLAQSQVCADKLATQNGAVDAVAGLGRLVTAGNAAALAAIKANGDKLGRQAAGIDALAKRPTPIKADGSRADCRDAWREIERLQGVTP